jgi:two-component system chemotaxis response regulator CheY
MKGMPPDVVMSCMYFDRMTGSELLINMREDEVLKDVPFMLISSEGRHECLEIVKQAGVMAILPKPFSVDDMHTALEATAQFIDPEEFEDEDFEAESLQVLIVEDSVTSSRHIANLLKGMGIEHISYACDGIEAIEEMQETIFDVVITDFNMPEMDGERLTSYIRNESSQSSIPILMVTSEHDEARLNSVMKSGVSAICDKPFIASHVKSLLSQILHH